MSAADNTSEDSSPNLLPHQAAFRDTVFNPSDMRIVVLRSAPGFGKLGAFVAVARKQIISNPKSRVLFLAPAALTHQIAERLRSEGVPSSRIDRFRFRELLETSKGDEIWPPGAVSVLSRDFANQTDVQERLSQTHWELLIADEVHQLGTARAETLRRLISGASKVVLATGTHVERELERIATPEMSNIVTWHRDMIVDKAGRPLFIAPRPKLHVVSFSASIAEDQLRETVSALSATLERAGKWQTLVAHTLRRHLESSPAALERVLRTIIEGRAELQTEVEEAPLQEAEEVDEMAYRRADHTSSNEVKLLVERAIQQIELNRTDAKLAAFAALLKRLCGSDGTSRRVCVVTNYATTLYYLAAELEVQEIGYHAFHGGMTLDARAPAMDSFRNVGGILLTTSAAVTEGISLPDTSDLVLFDLPTNGLVLQQLLGRFDGFGRKDQLNVHALAFSRGSEEIAQGLATLRTVLNA